MQSAEFFAEYCNREEQIKELKDELKLALDSFAASNNLTTKGILKGIKEYKEWLKDKAAFTVTDHDADTIFEPLIKTDG